MKSPQRKKNGLQEEYDETYLLKESYPITCDESSKYYFQINWMNMRNAETGEVIWKSDGWYNEVTPMNQEYEGFFFEARIPSSILDCAIVSREINFSIKKEEITNLKLVQRMMLNGSCIEQWTFNFGYVIPNSTNTWQHVIKSAGKDRMMSAEVLSGNLTIGTSFYDEELLIHNSVVRVFYTT